MAKGNYKSVILNEASTYRAWHVMFIAKYKSEKLWKYVDRLVTLFDPDLRCLSLNTTASTTKTSSVSLTMDISAIEIQLDKKEAYEVGFEQTKKKCFMSINKSHLATILELSSPKEIFEALDKKYSATNSICLHQLFRNCPAISTQKNVVVVEKYKAMLNFNTKICIQKLEFTFRHKHLINFLMASIPSIYESIVNNLNMCETLNLEKTIHAL